MPDRKPKPDRPTPHKEKLCKTCKRPFHWTEQNARDWDILKFCSEACSGYRPEEQDAALEAAKLVAGDPRNKSHAARRDWDALMEPARSAARRLVAQGLIVMTQHNRPVDPATAKGPIRLRRR